MTDCETTSQQLSSYVKTANTFISGKGVSTGMSVMGGVLLASQSSTEAAVVYSTPQDITLSAGNSFTGINIDAAPRLMLIWDSRGTPQASVIPSPGGALVGADHFVSNLNLNSGISIGNNWYASAANLFYGNQAENQFDNVNPGYVGFRFNPGSGDLYGWLHIDSIAVDKSSYHVSGWAYEDSGSPINAGDGESTGSAVPEPASLALLACGVAGLLALRRKKAMGITLPND